MASPDSLITEACASRIACATDRELLVIIAQSLASTAGMTATELLDAACVSRIACLQVRELLIVIAQAVSAGGTSGGSGVVSDGTVDPVAPPANPAVANLYTNTAALPEETLWLWPAGGPAWIQIV